VPYLGASEVMIDDEALYQVYVPFTFTCSVEASLKGMAAQCREAGNVSGHITAS